MSLMEGDDRMMRVLNLGAGVQSTVLFLQMLDGDLPRADVAIFADTGDEPEAVYRHLDYLDGLGGVDIVRCSAGNLGDNLIKGVNATGQRFISIPSYLSRGDGKNTGMGRRQCTTEFKINPIEQKIREILGVPKGKQLPRETVITQILGLSFDEPKRVDRVKARYLGRRNWRCEFPLFDDEMTRTDCVHWLEKRLPGYVVPRSACVFCPYKSDQEWLRLKTDDPGGWQRAVEIDRAIRAPSSTGTKDVDHRQYLHRSCKPLELVELTVSPPHLKAASWSQMDCEGMCGV